MEKKEMLWIASRAIGKGYTYEQVCDGDDCYELEGEEGMLIKEQIGEYMEELQDIGRTAFYEKYKEYFLY
jgi:hypothetical protein